MVVHYSLPLLGVVVPNLAHHEANLDLFTGAGGTTSALVHRTRSLRLQSGTNIITRSSTNYTINILLHSSRGHVIQNKFYFFVNLTFTCFACEDEQAKNSNFK